MRGPVVDLVLLVLVVAFFGVQQRRRPEAYFRFWLAGWVLVLASMAVWELSLEGSRALLMQEAIREALLACGGVAFAFSFVAKQRHGKLSLLQGFLVAVPLCIGLELIVTEARGRGTLIALVVLGEILTMAITWIARRPGRGWLLGVMVGLCPVFAAWMIAMIVTGHADGLLMIALGHIFIVAGLSYATMRRKGGRTIGSIGFLMWGLCYLLAQPLYVPAWGVAAVVAIWSIPKYLVAFGMILKVFTMVNAEYAALNARHQSQYEEYRILFDSNPHPMAIYDAATRHLLAVNDAAVEVYGHSRETFLRMFIDDVRAEQRGNEDPVPRGIAKRVSRHKRANGTTFDVDITGNDVTFEGRAARLVLVMDITEREKLNRELIRAAHHDALTGLPNRVMLEDRISQWLTRCVREDSMGAFLTVDIDHFKAVNDTYGHLVGDECLKAVADRLKSRVRQVDTIARTGGEEFTIIIGGLKTQDGMVKMSAGLLALFERPLQIGGMMLPMTISIGVALYPDDGEDVDTLRRKSDQALYRAKQTGRNRAVFASDVTVWAAKT